MEAINKMMLGYIMAIKHLTGDDSKGEYYREFFNQARSKDGLMKT